MSVGSILLSCTSESTTPPFGGRTDAGVSSHWFNEESESRGLRYVTMSGHDRDHLIPEITVGGAALFDMDDDGDLDAYLVQGGALESNAGSMSTNQLFSNDGAGVFENVTSGSGSDQAGYGMGVATGDYDNDGDTDIYVTNVDSQCADAEPRKRSIR